ncbi:MAG: hypothetical protein GY816_13895 [Cytophagales bacterium]|nr:hypothetical protein [Cytophagales bacterium]
MRKKKKSVQAAKIQPLQAYKGLLEISVAKKKDLVRLCQKGIILSENHSWYQKLPSSGKKKNDCVEFSENENSDDD